MPNAVLAIEDSLNDRLLLHAPGVASCCGCVVRWQHPYDAAPLLVDNFEVTARSSDSYAEAACR
jgi:hypothetical protein